jgi:hypothetical protein
MATFALTRYTQNLRSDKRQRVMVQQYDYEVEGKPVVKNLVTIMEWNDEHQMYQATHQTDVDYVFWEDNTYFIKKQK